MGKEEDQNIFTGIIHIFKRFFYGDDGKFSKVRLARKFMRKKKYDKAIEMFYKALEDNKNNKEAYIGLGETMMLAEGTSAAKDAVSCFQKAVNINPFFDLAYERIIETYLKTNQKQKAFEERKRFSVMKILRENPDNPMMNNNMGIFLLKQNRFQQSIFFFQRAVNVDPSFQTAYVNLSIAYFKYGATEKAGAAIANRLFEKVIDTVDRSSKFGMELSALLIKTKALIRLKRYDEALRTCNESKRLDPSNKEIYTLQNLILKGKAQAEDEKIAYARYKETETDNKKSEEKKSIADESDKYQ